MSEREGLYWDDDEVTGVDLVAQLPMLQMRDADREARSEKPTVRMKPITKAGK